MTDMKRIRTFCRITLAGLAAMAILTSSPAAAAADRTAAGDTAGRDRFNAAYVDRAGTPPFSFTCGGKPSAGVLPAWKVKADSRGAEGMSVKTVAYTDPATGLRVTAVYKIYTDFPAVEWVVTFKNEGAADTPILEDVQACAVELTGWGEKGPVTVYRARGSSAERSDFAPITDTLGPQAEVQFGPTAGRSSDTSALPFFNIAADGRGVVAAIGWSGRWQATVTANRPPSAVLKAGMRKTRFRLHPGEEVRTPSMALVFWKSPDRLAGHNLFRRFILAHHSPRPNGKPLVPPLSHGLGFGGPFPCNEYVCATESYALAMIDRLKQFGIEPENLWIDAGWYENATRQWWAGVGNWKVNRTNFPRGLRPVTDAARSWGKGFVLWFEPERVYEGTRIDKERPEWVTKLPGNPNRLFNLGDPAALAWLTNDIATTLETEGITIYRQDFNFDPAPYWDAMDAPDRVGIAEMKHIAGLYAFWDGLLGRIPGLLIDNCASGGRRIDLETTSRSVPLWRTDYSYFEPNGYQCHTYGLHLFIPSSGTGNNNPAKYNFRSSTSGAVVLGWELNNSFNVAQALEDLAEYRVLRPYFRGDFYPLTDYSTSDEAWTVFQWDRPEERDGILLAFRRNLALVPTITVKPHELDPAADYEVTYDDYGITVFKNGKELMEGLSLKIPEAPGSLLVKYRRVR